jgi:hypothetical protein
MMAVAIVVVAVVADVTVGAGQIGHAAHTGAGKVTAAGQLGAGLVTGASGMDVGVGAGGAVVQPATTRANKSTSCRVKIEALFFMR